MSDHRSADDDKDKEKDRAVAKTAGFVVFSGIAMSILKALNPNLKSINHINHDEPNSLPDSTNEPSHTSPPPPQPILIKKSASCTDSNVSQSSSRTIEIVRGDTLWGLSREYGVSIEAIKEANGLTGDTIYAGKKLIIP